MLTVAGQANLVTGFIPTSSAPMITHLQFANGTIIFCATEEEEGKNMLAIIRCFEAVFELKVNLSKSSLIGVCTEMNRVEHLVELWGCKVGSLPTSYLGLPLCTGGVSKSLWNPVVEKVESKLVVWKAKYLSLGSRVTLIKSVLANLPIYFMTLFKCPKSIINRIERLERDFLWHGNDGKNKFHLVDWNLVCQPKINGGLGIRPLKLMNQAFEKNYLWRQIVFAKYKVKRKR